MRRIPALIRLGLLAFVSVSVFVFASASASAASPDVPPSVPQTAHDPPTGVVPPPDSPLPHVTLDDCVARALAKNFTVRIQHITIGQAQDSVVIAEAAFDPTFGYTGQKTITQEPLSPGAAALLNGIPAGNESDQSSVFSVTQPLITGATVTGNYTQMRQETNPILNLPNPYYGDDASIVVTQPLLQGAGTDYNRALIANARLGVRIANLNFKSTVLTLVYNVETAYYDLLFAREQYLVQQDTLKLAQQLYDENTIKRQTGVLTDLDVMQAKVGVATAQNQLILDEQAVHNSEDALLQDLGERAFLTAVGPIDFPDAGEPAASFARSYKLARDNGPSLAVADATIEQYKLAALRARRNYLPQLNVNGGLGYASAGHSDYQAAFGNWNGYNWTAGLAVSVPWGLRAGKAQYRQALGNVQSEQLTKDQIDQGLVVQVRAAVRAVQTNLASVHASGEETRFAQKEYELQKAEFDAGLATSYDVLQAQNNLETARVSELQAKVNLLIAEADLRFLEGTSLDLYHIELPE